MGLNKSNIAYFWVLLVVVVSVGVFVHLIKEDKPATLPIMELNNYTDALSATEAIGQNLKNEFTQNKFYWIGIEPDKDEYLELLSSLILDIKKQQNIKKIIFDEELNLKTDKLKQLGSTDVVALKENLFELGEKLEEYEKNGTSYILVSASIYTNSLLKKNPLHILKERNSLKPLTLSFAYFPITNKDEKNMTFGCRTEDQTGTSDWGCVIVSRARFARRKLIFDKSKPWVGLVDSSGEKEYILLFKKNDN